MAYCIYKHQNKTNGKVYIGQTNNCARRWESNGIQYKACPRFYSAIQHYGWDNFEHEILQDNLTQEQANDLEIAYIKQYDSTNPEKGYNILVGGQGLTNYWSLPEHKAQQSLKRKEYYATHPEERDFLKNISLDHPEWRQEHSEFMKAAYKEGKGFYQINEFRKRAIRCVETAEEFESIMEASRAYHLPAGNISKCLQGERKTCGGFHWESMS